MDEKFTFEDVQFLRGGGNGACFRARFLAGIAGQEVDKQLAGLDPGTGRKGIARDGLLPLRRGAQNHWRTAP